MRKWFSTNQNLTLKDLTAIVNTCVKFKFIRSSGPGGQNVNKVSTCAVGVLNLNDKKLRNLYPEAAISRLYNGENSRNKISKAGDLTIRSEEQRYQHLNKAITVKKLIKILQDALIEPVEAEGFKPVTAKGKQKRLEYKKHRKDVKSSRKKL